MVEEKLLNIPLKSAWTNRTRSKRANVTVNAIRLYFNKHFKVSDIKISEGVNQVIWKRGSKKPPARIQVKAIKDGETMNVLLPDEKLKPKEEKKGIKDKLLGRGKKTMTEEEKKEFEEFKQTKSGSTEAVKVTESPKTEEPKTEAKPEKKEDSKEAEKPKERKIDPKENKEPKSEKPEAKTEDKKISEEK